MSAYDDHLANLSHHKGLPKMLNHAIPPLPPGPREAELSLLLDRLVPVLSDSGAKKRIETLRAATAEHREAGAKLAADRADFDRHQKAERASFDAMMHARSTALDERESAHHESVASFHSEQASERKRLAEMQASAERDRAQAADLLERAKRKIAAFESN
jgi:hypothetical protein